jgi:hypothetical protein
MTSPRQIEANRRNARLSTGPCTEEGKIKSRQNALRHGLTAETIIGPLEDADDYAAFELAITADFEAQTAVERELVLRLASVLWRLRRATAIESGLFELQAGQVLQFRQARQAEDFRQRTVVALHKNKTDSHPGASQKHDDLAGESLGCVASDHRKDLTRSFVRLAKLPNYPLDRLSRYEATLWRQASQILFALHVFDPAKPWSRRRTRGCR